MTRTRTLRPSGAACRSNSIRVGGWVGGWVMFTWSLYGQPMYTWSHYAVICVRCLVTLGHSGSLWVTLGHCWPLLATLGHSWSLLVTPGHSWSLLVTLCRPCCACQASVLRSTQPCWLSYGGRRPTGRWGELCRCGGLYFLTTNNAVQWFRLGGLGLGV